MGSQSSWPARLLLVVLHMLAAGGGNGGARALPLPGWAPALSAWRGRASQRSRGGSSASACSELFGAAAAQQGPMHTVLIVADPGGFSGVPEAHYFLAHLEGAVAVPSGTTMCHSATRGKLLGQPVLVVTSGIGQRSAASCAASLLTLCSQRFKEVIFFGTAGCSVQRGGVLNAGECSAANPDTQASKAPCAHGVRGLPAKVDVPGGAVAVAAMRPVTEAPPSQPAPAPTCLPQVARIGDLCISPFALDGTCRIASWQQQSAGWPDACSLPQESAGPEAQDILGHCLFSAVPPGSMELTEELLAAARAAQGSYHARWVCQPQGAWVVGNDVAGCKGSGTATSLSAPPRPHPAGRPHCCSTKRSTGRAWQLARGWRTKCRPGLSPRSLTTPLAVKLTAISSTRVRGAAGHQWWPVDGK